MGLFIVGGAGVKLLGASVVARFGGTIFAGFDRGIDSSATSTLGLCAGEAECSAFENAGST